MWIGKAEFSKLLQENESRIIWNSDTAPECHIVHEWRLAEGGRVLLREYQRRDGSMFWVNAELLERRE